MPKRGRSAGGQSDRLSAVQSRLGACSSELEPATIFTQGPKDAPVAFGSLHPNHINSSLLDLSQDILNAQHTHASSVSPRYGDGLQREKLTPEECTSVLLRLFSMPGEQNTPPLEDFGSTPNMPKAPWSSNPATSPLSNKEFNAQDGGVNNNNSPSNAHSSPRNVLMPSNVDNQMGRAVLQAPVGKKTRSLLVAVGVPRQPLSRQPCQPLHSQSSQSCTYMRSVSPKPSHGAHLSSDRDFQQPGSDADVSGLFSDQSPPTHCMDSPIQSTSTAVIPMPSSVGSGCSHSPTPPQLHAPNMRGNASFHRQLPLSVCMPSTGSHNPRRMTVTSSASSAVEPFSACVHTALFRDDRECRAPQQTISAPCTHGISRKSAHMVVSEASRASPAQTQGLGRHSVAPSEASDPFTHRSTGSRARAASKAASVTSVDSAKKPPVRESSCFGPQSASISSSPRLAYASIVLLAISGVMGLAHCSAFIMILLDGRTPDGTVLTSLLLATEVAFATSCFLQWWLVSGADRMFDCLKWAGNPSGSLPIRAARSLVLSTAHQLTWFALVGQLVGSLLLVGLIPVGIVFSETPYNLVPYLMFFTRVAIFACNYIFIYEALQSWVPFPLLGSHALRRCIASDAELLFLVSCALYCTWEVLDAIGVAGDSTQTLAIVTGVCLGGGALTRTFGASLLLWARNAALKDQTVEERKLRAMLTNWYVQPEASPSSGNGSKASKQRVKATSQRYLDSAAVATRLMVPDTLPRALSLQNLASCGSVLVMLLNVARQVKKSSCKLDTYLVHMLHILTAGAQIVQNHNQRSCVSVVYVACDESVQDGAQRHILLVQQLHPSHVDRLPGQQRLDAKRMQQVKLKLTHVIPMLLSLDSKLSGTARRVFDDEGPAESGVKAFTMPSQALNQQEEYGGSTSTPTAIARSSHMQSCDVRSAQRTPGASSTAVMPTSSTSRTTPAVDKVFQMTPTAVHDRRQQMQWPLVKGMTEVQSPGTPGAQEAGPSSSVPAGKADLEMKSDSIGSTKWEPLPCLPSQIVAGYAFVIDGPVAPEIGHKAGSGDADSLWPSITAVELNAEHIRAICKAKSKEVRHDTSLVRTDSMDALVQVHVVPAGGQGDIAEAINASNLRGPVRTQSPRYTALQNGAAVSATPWASGQQVEHLLNNLGVPLQPHAIEAAQPSGPGSHTHSYSGGEDQHAAVNTTSPDGDGETDPLATPKAFSRSNSRSIFSTSRPPTVFQPVAPLEASRMSDSQVSGSLQVPSQPPFGVPVPTVQKPTHKNNVSISSPWDPPEALANDAWFQVTENEAKHSQSPDAVHLHGRDDAASSDSDESSSLLSSDNSSARHEHVPTDHRPTGERRATMPAIFAPDKRTGAPSSSNSTQHEADSFEIDFFLPLPPGTITHRLEQ